MRDHETVSLALDAANTGHLVLATLHTTTTVSNPICENKVHEIVSSMQAGRAAGNLLLNDSLAVLVKGGAVESEESLSKAVDKANFAKRLGRLAV